MATVREWYGRVYTVVFVLCTNSKVLDHKLAAECHCSLYSVFEQNVVFPSPASTCVIQFVISHGLYLGDLIC